MDTFVSADRSGLPRSLLGWAPFVWGRFLFPGPSRLALESHCWWHWLTLLVVPFVLLYPSLGFPLLEPDESRYAQIPFEMIRSGDYLVPRLQGEPYLDKPPLFYWLVAGSYRLIGLSEQSARLIPVLAIHGCILLTFGFGRRWFGNRSAFMGALTLSLAPGLVTIGRMLLLDGLLALWTTLALFSAFEAMRHERLGWGWWFLAALACGLGILTKGPVALLLLLPVLWLQRRLAGGLCQVGFAGWLGFFLIVSVVALPWYLLLCLRIPGFARYFFWDHHVLRFLTPFAHARGVWFYGPVLLMGLLPATLWIWPFGRFLFSGDEMVAQKRSPELGFVLLASCWCVLFFTLSTGKLPTYILPAFPPLALAFGYFLTEERWTTTWVFRGTAAMACFLIVVMHHGLLPWYGSYRSPSSRVEEVGRICADPELPVVCYPRNCDSLAFSLQRADFLNFRSAEIEELRTFVRSRPRTLILCTHRHSLQGLKQLLPPEIKVVKEIRFGLQPIQGISRQNMKILARLMGETALGLCDLVVVEAPPPYRNFDADSRQARWNGPAGREETIHGE